METAGCCGSGCAGSECACARCTASLGWAQLNRDRGRAARDRLGPAPGRTAASRAEPQHRGGPSQLLGSSCTPRGLSWAWLDRRRRGCRLTPGRGPAQRQPWGRGAILHLTPGHVCSWSSQMSEAMAMNLLEDWCRGMEVDIHRSLLVTGIPADCGQAEIEETLNGVLSPLGTYRVLNRIFLRAENVKAALVEVGEGVNVSTVPREFPGRGGVWRVACRDPTQDAEFLKNLNEFLDAEGRTWEDVVRLLQLNHPPRPQNQPWENWAEALGVLLGAAVQVVFCIDAELRSREEARAQEAEEELAAWALVARKKVKKEPGLATEVGSALKVENLIRFNEQCDPPKPFVHRAGAKSRSRRKKQKRNSRQDAAPWKKPKGNHSNGSAYLVTRPEVCHPRNMAISKPNKSNQRARVKQEWVLKRSLAKSAWKVPRGRPQGALLEAKSPESHRDGGQESPPKRKAFRKSLVPVRKKKVSLGPVSYLHGHPKDAKKSVILRKGPGSRRAGPAHRAPRGPQPGGAPASASRGPKAKPGGFPCASKDPRRL